MRVLGHADERQPSEARTVALEASRRGQLAHDHGLAAGIAHLLCGELDNLRVVPGDGYTEHALLAHGSFKYTSSGVLTRIE
jgi:hypothetical protein